MKTIKGLIFSAVTMVAVNAFANDQLIVKFKSKNTAIMMMDQLQGPGMPEIKELAADFNLFTIKKGAGIHIMSTASIKEYLEQMPEVEYVQYDHPITPRESVSPSLVEKVSEIPKVVEPGAEVPVAELAEEPVVGSVVEELDKEPVVGLEEGAMVDPVAEDSEIESTEELVADSEEDLIQVQPPLFTIPEDTDFNKQWSLQEGLGEGEIGAPEAWSITKGGKDANGHEIVVAVIDAGIMAEHKDLKENMWVNKAEIAGNNIDDDNNGFIDDINGWDFTDDDGQLKVSQHGTHVSGIIGARGNNSIGISGVNWDVKIMGLTARLYSTSHIIKAYTYVIKQKELWVKSKGKEGANVVATNSSFGYDRADCNSGEYPVWNDMYEQMGQLGILSAAAGPNANWDIDRVGDVPTGCNSDYIVAVTSTNRKDEKVRNACYGQKTIDISAPGDGIYSTISRNTYGEMGGTSMATPHIAGAIALMHAAASQQFADAYLADPAQASIDLKEIMLKAVKKTADLEEKLVSGGRLDILKAVTDISKYEKEDEIEEEIETDHFEVSSQVSQSSLKN